MVPPGAPAATAGLSLGEYSALVVAGAIEFEKALELVALRGLAMQVRRTKSPPLSDETLFLRSPVPPADVGSLRSCSQHDVRFDRSR